MKHNKFTLTLELGNDAMCTREDVARKLREVAKDITKVLPDSDSGSIRDINGNRVGKWEFMKERIPLEEDPMLDYYGVDIPPKKGIKR